MKFFAVFAAIVAVACGSPSGWTLDQLSAAIQSPHTSAAYLPYLEQALNEMMANLFAGHQVETVTVAIPNIEVPSMTLAQVSAALENPDTNPALVPHLENALNEMMDALASGLAPVASASAPITVPAMDITFWTLSQLSDALESTSTSPVVVPYLVNALNQIMDAMIAGEQMEFAVIATPAGIIPVEDGATLPIMDVMPVMPTPVEVAPVNPTPVVVAPVSPAPAAPSSPLVQIIINIKQQEESVVAPAPIVVAPTPVAMDQPEPISIVEQAPIVPEPVIVVEQAPVAAVPIGVVSPISVFPIGVVAPSA